MRPPVQEGLEPCICVHVYVHIYLCIYILLYTYIRCKKEYIYMYIYILRERESTQVSGKCCPWHVQDGQHVSSWPSGIALCQARGNLSPQQSKGRKPSAKVCNLIALWAAFRGFVPLCYIVLASR